MNGIQDCQKSESAQSVSQPTGIEKKCSKCGKIKDISRFSPAKNTKDKLRPSCKDCGNEYMRKHYSPQYRRAFAIRNKEKIQKTAKLWREKNKEKIKDNFIKYKEKNRDRLLENGRNYYWQNRESRRLYAKTREKDARHLWAAVTINSHREAGYLVKFKPLELKEKIKNISACQFCGVELSFGNNKKMRPNSPTLDRINNEKIMTLENTQILCAFCNKVKGDHSIAELFSYLNRLINLPIFAHLK